MSQKKEKSSRSNSGKTKVKYVYLDKYQKNKTQVDKQLDIQNMILEELDKDIRRIHIRLIVLISLIFIALLLYILYNQ